LPFCIKCGYEVPEGAAFCPNCGAPAALKIKTSYLERDNKGTLFETSSEAVAYWVARMSSPKKDPFVLFTFDSETEARNALLGLNCIHEAGDSGKPICTETINFGYYEIEGTYEAWVCGSELTHDMWQEAMEKFNKHGGRRKNDLEPEKAAPVKEKAVMGDASKVVFVREDRKQTRGLIMTYRIYKAPDKASAMAYLENNPVTKNYYYLIVETPEGNFCRDIQGIYKE